MTFFTPWTLSILIGEKEQGYLAVHQIVDAILYVTISGWNPTEASTLNVGLSIANITEKAFPRKNYKICLLGLKPNVQTSLYLWFQTI